MSVAKRGRWCDEVICDEVMLKFFLEIVLSQVLKRMETEILEFPLSHQYNNKTNDESRSDF